MLNSAMIALTYGQWTAAFSLCSVPATPPSRASAVGPVSRSRSVHTATVPPSDRLRPCVVSTARQRPVVQRAAAAAAARPAATAASQPS